MVPSKSKAITSPSSRRAWIEIDDVLRPFDDLQDVALLAEGVDRNIPKQLLEAEASGVALLAEGVDRNPSPGRKDALLSVALLAEGVDRNIAPARYALWSASRPPRGGRG